MARDSCEEGGCGRDGGGMGPTTLRIVKGLIHWVDKVPVEIVEFLTRFFRGNGPGEEYTVDGVD
jgi:hypothetical protein